MHFGMILGICLMLLEVNRLPKCYQTSMRTLASKKEGSEEARVPDAIPSWCQEGAKGGGNPPPLWVGNSEERQKRIKGKRKVRKLGGKEGR